MSGLPPSLSETVATKYDTATRQWVTQVFPSLDPSGTGSTLVRRRQDRSVSFPHAHDTSVGCCASGRRDVTLLGQWLRVKESVLSQQLDASLAKWRSGGVGYDQHAAAALEISKQVRGACACACRSGTSVLASAAPHARACESAPAGPILVLGRVQRARASGLDPLC